jgi:hypothetical protein
MARGPGPGRAGLVHSERASYRLERPERACTRSGSGSNLWVARLRRAAVADYATLLRDHVTLKVRSIDRIFLQAYVPKLQSVGQVCTFLRWQRAFHIPSSAAFGKLGEHYVKDIQRFAESDQIPLVHFEKGESKEQRCSRCCSRPLGPEETVGSC